jgi:putative effector of murein hydrolase LrgA (UPF0299 family)
MIEARRFTPLLAAAGIVILLQQGLDVAQLLPSTDFATPAGRVRQLLALEARSPGLLVADFLLLWALLAAGLFRLRRVAAVTHLLVGLGLLALVPIFLGDAGHLIEGMAGGEATAFRIAVARTLGVLVALGSAGLLAGRFLLVGRARTLP